MSRRSRKKPRPEVTYFGAHLRVFIEGEDLDPVEVARRAREWYLSGAPPNRIWLINDVNYNQFVDIEEQKVLEKEARDDIELRPGGVVAHRRSVTGPDGQPMDIWIEIEPG